MLLIYYRPRGFFSWRILLYIRLSRILKSFLSLLQGMVKGNIDVERYELEEKTSFIKQIHQDNTILNFEGKNVLLM